MKVDTEKIKLIELQLEDLQMRVVHTAREILDVHVMLGNLAKMIQTTRNGMRNTHKIFKQKEGKNVN